MATTHHPSSKTLWAYAIGNLDEASSVLVATHLALCPSCRRETAAMEAAGGAMFEAIGTSGPAKNDLDDRALDRIMSRLDENTPIRSIPVRFATMLPGRRIGSRGSGWPRESTGSISTSRLKAARCEFCAFNPARKFPAMAMAARK
jgi:anti-sigma factor RsiW